MSETPIERLNYFNGQRLEADDLRLEQQYHVRIQRLLMKSLFSPGVAEGFEVSPIEAGKKVVVRPGLALDDLGRAIILVNPIELVPQGRYLCVRYAERKEGVQGGECKVKVNGPGDEQLARSGGPGRITSEPDFFWRRAPPLADTRELVIAELTFKEDCIVDKVDSRPRKQAVPAPLARVRPISLEGEKDIDSRNPKVIRFHIAHARPTAVTLYLRASAFSTLHYTEMPRHNHSSKEEKIAIGQPTEVYLLETKAASGHDAHTHGVGTLHTGGPGGSTDGPHKHKVVAQVALDITASGAQSPNIAEIGLVIQHPPVGHLYKRTLTDGFLKGVIPIIGTAEVNIGGVNMEVSEGAHFHGLSGKTDLQTEIDAANRHTHSIEFVVAHFPKGAKDPAGVLEARTGEPPLSYFIKGLQVRIDKLDRAKCIEAVLKQSRENNPNIWKSEHQSLGGEGLPHEHPLVKHGTGPIRLDLIDGLDFSPGTDHEIELSVEGDGNGGCIQYNLYVE